MEKYRNLLLKKLKILQKAKKKVPPRPPHTSHQCETETQVGNNLYSKINYYLFSYLHGVDALSYFCVVGPVANTGRNNRRVADATDKLSQISLTRGSQSMKMKQPPPPSMKAGGWHGRPYEASPVRGFPKRVNG